MLIDFELVLLYYNNNHYLKEGVVLFLKLQDWIFSVKLFLENLFRKGDLSYSDADKDYVAAHEFSIHNRTQLEHSVTCGCFCCVKVFSPDEIDEWIDREDDTALCPYCGIDSVLGDASGYEISEEFLTKMYKRWFTKGEDDL